MATATSPQIRRRWPWVLAAVILAPFLLLAAAAWSFLSLDPEADVLRRQIARSTGASWETKVQLNIGRVTVAALRGGLSFSGNGEIAEARRALKGLRRASVGVYRLSDPDTRWSQAQLLRDADAKMQRRGWSRMVGVLDGDDTVMIYVPEHTDDPRKVCVAVVSGHELVVVSAVLNPEELYELMVRHAGSGPHREVAGIWL
jgi:hypothetical protein